MNPGTTSVPTAPGAGRQHAGRPVLAVIATLAVATAAAVLLANIATRGDGHQPALIQPPAAPVEVAPAAAAPLVTAGYSVRSEPQTVYIAASPEQADAVRAGHNEANMIRANEGLPLLFDEVIVAAPGDEAAERDLNRFVASLPADIRIVDLRH